MPINKNELTKEQIAKAMSCETAEELMVLAKTEGIELTKEEAEAQLIELSDVELDSDAQMQTLLAAIEAVTPERICAAAQSVVLDTVYFLKGKEA